MSGTSMARRTSSGAVALLLQRHPALDARQQVKAALTATGAPVGATAAASPSPTRAGGGLVDLAAADVPLVLASPVVRLVRARRRRRAVPARR